METPQNRIKQLRNEHTPKLTQEKLAKEIGVTKLTISRWENEEVQIKLDKAQMLADYFSVPVGYLLGYTDYKNTDEYFEENKDTFSIDVDILNSIDTIGEKNLHVVRNFLKKEFIKEYSQVDERGGDWGDWDKETAVRVAMGNVNENLWGLPDSVVKLILYWSTLKEAEQDSLIGIIKVLSSYNLAKHTPPED